MARKLTDPNDDGVLEWSETVTDANGDSPSITVKLDAVDSGAGFQDRSTLASNVSWLDYTVSENTLGDGTVEATINLTADRSELTSGTKYRIRITAQSSGQADTSFTTLEVLSLNYFNIAGQEDRFRSEDGSRVKRGGVARVVATTSLPADIDIKFVANPANVDNPSFETTIENASENETTHEFFFGVDPSSLYAFKLVGRINGFDKEFESDLNYLSTGDTISFSFNTIQVNEQTEVTSATSSTTVETEQGTSKAEFPSTIQTDNFDDIGPASTQITTASKTLTQETNNFTTNITIS